MTDRDGQAKFICQGLQFALPQPHPCAVAAAAIGGDQQTAHLGVTRPSHALPPAPNGVDGEAGGVVVDADAHPAGVAGDVVDAIRHGAAEFGDLEVMHAHRLGVAFRAQLSASVLEIVDQFLFLGIDRDRGFARFEGRRHLGVDVIELRVAVGCLAALAGLAVALQAVVERSQQIGDDVVADTMAHCPQRLGQIAQAAAGPQQRRLRIAARCRFDQTPQIGQQRGVGLGQLLAPAARAAHAPRRRDAGRVVKQFGQAPIDLSPPLTGRIDAARGRRG